MDGFSWESVKSGTRRRMETVGQAVGATGISPNALTVLGLTICVAAGALIAVGHLAAGGVVFLLGSAFDMLDGAVARAMNKTSRFGAFLDSLLDRYSEAVIFGALILEVGRRGDLALVAGGCLALAGSLLVSYARARAEGLGLDCEVGAVQRTERVIILGAGLLFPHLLLTPAVWLLAVATNVTVVQRVLHVRRLLAEQDDARGDAL